MSTITIDKEKLEQYLAKFCSHYYKTENGKRLCDKKKKGECNLTFVDKIEMNCPYDCPHRDEYVGRDCTLGKCSYVKNAIKELCE